MINEKELYEAHTRLRPWFKVTPEIVKTYLETHILVAKCDDLKYAANLFYDWAEKHVEIRYKVSIKA